MATFTRLANILGVGLASFLVISASVFDSVAAKQLYDGTTIFEKSPRLVDVSTTYDIIYVSGATYYFTLELPENAGEPLQKVTIAQRQGSEDIKFNLDDTVAYEGTAGDKGVQLSLAKVDRDDNTNTIIVIFSEPIPPGKTVTIGLKPKRNPQFDGIYLFGVTAFPRGEKPQGLYLGVGRLQFYGRGDDLFWRR
jgi:Protein of unknown function (DUF2808)